MILPIARVKHDDGQQRARLDRAVLGAFQAVGIAVLLATAGGIVSLLCVHASRSVQLLSGGYIAFGLLGAFAYSPSTFDKNLNPTLVLYYDRVSSTYVVTFFAGIGALCCLGGLAARAIVGRPRTSRAPAAARPLALPSTWLVVAGLLLAVDVWGVGLHTLLHTPYYLATTGPPTADKVGTATTPLGLLIAANVMLSGQRVFPARVSAALVVTAYEAVLLGQATRVFTISPLIIYVGGVLGRRWSGRRVIAIGACAAGLAIVCLGPPLYLRAQPTLGLVVALRDIYLRPGALFGAGSGPSGNLLLGVPLSLYIAHGVPRLPLHDLWVSVNPLPGQLTGWPKLSPQLRLNVFEPYSAIGELANHGWVFLGTGAFLLGAVFEACETTASRITGPVVGPALRSAIVAVAGLILIRSTQYNLRTETRLVYYTIFLTFVAYLVDAARLRRDEPRPVSARSIHNEQPVAAAP